MNIIPAIIPRSFHDLEDHIYEVKDFSETVQIDVMDGIYVPEKSWPYKIVQDPDFARAIEDGGNMPGWENVQFEVDLMVSSPETVWRDWVKAGVSRIIVHLESTKDLKTLISDFKEENVPKDSFLYCQLGLAIQIDTNNEELYPYLEDVDCVQFMGIKKIGYQGQDFDERVLEKIKDIKKRKPDMVVSVDGGMDEETIPLVREAGAERVAVGSALFESENIKETYKYFKSL